MTYSIQPPFYTAKAGYVTDYIHLLALPLLHVAVHYADSQTVYGATFYGRLVYHQIFLLGYW